MYFSEPLIFMKSINLNKKIGHNIRQQRKRLGWSQEELAIKSRLNRSYIGGVERGERNIRISTVSKLAQALGIPPSDLLK